MHYLIARYKESEAFSSLRDSTKREYHRHLDVIRDKFGDLSIKQFDRAEIRPHIHRWRLQWKDRPRTADYALQVLSSVMAFAAGSEGLIRENPCHHLEKLYKANRAELIWTPDDLTKLAAVAAPEVMMCANLAALTGLRRSDVIRLSWSHVNEPWISIVASKNRQRVDIPIYAELRELLDSIPKKATTMLTNSRGRPWSANGWSTAWNRAKSAAGIDLHFHDLRGTAATRLYAADIAVRDIAWIMGWSETSVEKLIDRYVRKAERGRELIRRLDEYKTGTDSAKLSAKP
jgi:integrase